MTAETQQREANLRALVEKICEAARLAEEGASASQPLMSEVREQLRTGNADAWEALSGCISSNVPGISHVVDMSKQMLGEVKDVELISNTAQHCLRSNQLPAAELLLERRCVLAAQQERGREEHINALMRLAAVYQRQQKTDDAREARRAVAQLWEQSGRMTKDEISARLIELAQICLAASDTPEAERYARKALDLRQRAADTDVEAVIECLRVMMEVAERQRRSSDAQKLATKIAKLEAPQEALDEIERALTTYVRLPEMVDLTLRPEGITLHTSDFPRVIHESTGLDLREYFVDAFKDADFLKADEKSTLAKELFHCFETANSFVSGPDGARMVRSEVSVVTLPPAMSQGFVQTMNVEKEVGFRLLANLPDEATFTNISGITFNVGGKLIALSELRLQAVGATCVVTPVLAEQGQVQQSAPSSMFDSLKAAGKDLLVGAVMKMGKTSDVCRTQLPIVHEEFRQYLRDAMNFKALLHDRDKDLIMFIERSAMIRVEDPLTRALLQRGMRIHKKGEHIELSREANTVCDLGGMALEIAPTIKLRMAKHKTDLKIEELSGIGVEVPFDAPSELLAIGVDLKRALPKKIMSLSLAGRDEEDRRRLVVRTAPGCWMALDLNIQMQPAMDARGNWLIVGVTNNPISGVPQKFFLRLDSQNNLTMTPRELAEIVTQTAIEGFDPSDPFTWKWGAVALGGHALLTAGAVIRGVAGDTTEVKKTARKIGRFIGKLLNDL